MEQSLRCGDHRSSSSFLSKWNLVWILLGGAVVASVPRIAAGQPPLLLSANRGPVSKCNVDCSDEPSKLVCGTDGRTYRSRCEVRRAACEGHSVQVKYGGKCQGGRSSRRRNSNRPGVKTRCPNPNNGFTKELMAIFVGEYNRSRMFTNMGMSTEATATTTTDPILNSVEKKAIDWKFFQLDTNGNHFLDRQEVRNFRRMMKKIRSLRACAKRFIVGCDKDRDRQIVIDEWTSCLSSGSNSERTGRTDHSGTPSAATRGVANSQSPALRSEPVPTAKAGDSRHVLIEEDLADCVTERKTATEQQLAQMSMSIYMPECEPDGRYKQVQCYASTGYCCCVDQDTGKPIGGTWVKDAKPDCEKLIKASRPIKGCPEDKKQKFVAEFVDFLSEEMSAAIGPTNKTSGTSADKSDHAGTVDAISRWKFEKLDGNSDKVLDASEWKNFRKELTKNKSIRKCGKSFIKFCDHSGDNNISLQEWTECFSVLKDRKTNNGSKNRQKGQNPLDKYLKNK